MRFSRKNTFKRVGTAKQLTNKLSNGILERFNPNSGSLSPLPTTPKATPHSANKVRPHRFLSMINLRESLSPNVSQEKTSKSKVKI